MRWWLLITICNPVVLIESIHLSATQYKYKYTKYLFDFQTSMLMVPKESNVHILLENIKTKKHIRAYLSHQVSIFKLRYWLCYYFLRIVSFLLQKTVSMCTS